MSDGTPEFFQDFREADCLYQGDIFKSVPIVFPNPDTPWLFARPDPPPSLAEALKGTTPKRLLPRTANTARDPDPWTLKEELIVGKATLRDAMILTQSCDIEQRSNLQVAPICSAAGLGGKKSDDLRNGRINYWFYLPPILTGGDEQYVDFTLITSANKRYFKADIAEIIGRLSEASCFSLKKHLGRFFGRPFGFDHNDTAWKTGKYKCVPCFYNHSRITTLEVIQDANFPPCPSGCPKEQWVETIS